MSTSSPSFAVVGAGAVGTYYGARLAQHGHAVHFLLRSDYAAVRQNGLTIRSPRGDFSLPPGQLHIYDSAPKMPPVDVVLVTLKTTSNAFYAPLISPLLHQNTAILTLQNGLGNEDQLAALFGPRRILGGLAFTCINRIAPGEIEHLAHGHIKLGEFLEGPSPRAAGLAQLFAASNIECEMLPSLRFGRWEKLVWNVPFNGLSAALDLTTDRILATPGGVELVRQIMAEVLAAARADGVTLPEHLIQSNIDRTMNMGAYRTSMHVDRTLGRPMEVEAILGEPVRAAQRAGIAVPHMQQLYTLTAMIASQFSGVPTGRP